MIKYNCDYCSSVNYSRPSLYNRKKRHFCNRKCYADFAREKLPQEEHNAWKGGITNAESKRRYMENNRQKVRAANKARRLREMNAPGSHTEEEWQQLLKDSNYTCVDAEDGTCKGRLTKDHEVSLLMGGSNDISNIRVRCTSHNSRKQHKLAL